MINVFCSSLFLDIRYRERRKNQLGAGGQDIFATRTIRLDVCACVRACTENTKKDVRMLCIGEVCVQEERERERERSVAHTSIIARFCPLTRILKDKKERERCTYSAALPSRGRENRTELDTKS